MSRTLIQEGLIALYELDLSKLFGRKDSATTGPNSPEALRYKKLYMPKPAGQRRAISSGMQPNPLNKTMRDLYSIPGFAKSRGIGGLGLTDDNYSDHINKYFKDRKSPRIDYNPTWNEYEAARDAIEQQNQNPFTRLRKLEQLDKYFDYYNPHTNRLRPEFREYEV